MPLGLLLTPAARAGSYTVTYSGGNTVAVSSTGGTTTVPYSIHGNGQWGGATGSNGYGQASASCTGAITAHFTWQPDSGQTSQTDPPPSICIMQETCGVTWQGYNGGGSSGVGGPITGDSSNGGQGGTLYTVKPSPGGSFDWSATGSPSATAGVPSPYGGCSVSLYYSAAAYPVTVGLGGTTNVNGTQEALTGQQITATLNAPFQVDPNSYSWSVSGHMFKNYDWTLSSNQLTQLTDADYFRSYFTFYDATAETITPICYATVVCPDGTRLSVNAQQSITILKPTETAWAISATNTPDGPFYFDYANGNFYPQYGVQATWNPITVTVPSPFAGGQVCLAQLANFNRVDTRVAVNGASNTYVVTPAAQGLDTGFPYRIAYQVDAQGNIMSDANGGGLLLSPPQWNVAGSGPSSGAGGDRPVSVCEPALVNGDTGGSDWRSSTDTDQFDTWTMYRPPAVGGQPTVWVPLQTIHWAWSGSANVHTDASGNVICHPDGNAQWYYTIPQVNPSGNPTNTTAFPTWTTVIPYGLTMGPPVVH